GRAVAVRAGCTRTSTAARDVVPAARGTIASVSRRSAGRRGTERTWFQRRRRPVRRNRSGPHETHRSRTACCFRRTGLLHRSGLTQSAKLGFTLLDAGGFQRIDEFEQVPLPAHELGAGLTTAAIVVGHRSQRIELPKWGRDVPRPPLAAIGKDGALVELTAAATAVWFAALSPQGVDRAGEQRFSSETLLKQLRELVLGIEELRAEGAELLVHGLSPRPICRSLP